MSFRTPVLTAIVAISALTPVQSASAQTYPTKPIHMIVPYPAGGGTDFFARLIGQKMSELVGQPIVVENKPGAATTSLASCPLFQKIEPVSNGGQQCHLVSNDLVESVRV